MIINELKCEIMKIDNDEFIEGLKAYNFNFIKNYPEKIESEIKDIESKAIKLLAIDGVFITLIITTIFSSMPQIIEKIPEWLLSIFNFLVIIYLLHFIIVGISSIMCFRIETYDYFDEILLKDKIISYDIKEISESTKEQVEFENALRIVEKNKLQLVKKRGCVEMGLHCFLCGIITLSIILILCMFFVFIKI